MMSVAGTRTPRAGKDKTTKSSLQNAKSGTESKVVDNPNPKIQPTAEQMRLAQIINDTKESDDPDLNTKIDQVVELTGKSKDEAIVALHDCDNDPHRAIDMLLEGKVAQGEWETSTKKKKNRQASNPVAAADPTQLQQQQQQQQPNANCANNKENRNRSEKCRDQEREPQDAGGSKNRGPPRLNRGGSSNRSWRGRESEKNERNLEDSKSHERNAENRGSRGRGGMMNGRGRGRGSHRVRTFQNRGVSQSAGGGTRGGSAGGGGTASGVGPGPSPGPGGAGTFPRSIDTWTNSTAEQVEAGGGDTTMSVGNWGDTFPPTEDWDNDDWTGNLSETTVFTPSASAATNVAPLQDATNSPQSLDLSALLQKSVPTSTALTLTESQQQQQHSQFLSQFNQQATETIKSAIGISSNQPSSFQGLQPFPSSSAKIGSSQSFISSSPSQSLKTSIAIPGMQSNAQTAVSRLPPSSSGAGVASQSLPQRTKQQRARLPPPSKIPSSAVEMPDDAIAQLDVQFGGVEFGSEPLFSDFSTSVDRTSYQAVTGGQPAGLSASLVGNSLVKPSSESSVHSAYSSPKDLVQAASLSQSALNQSGLSQNALGQSVLSQVQKNSAADLLPFSTGTQQADRKTTIPFANQRSSQTSGLEAVLTGAKSDSTGLSSSSFVTPNASSYQSAYQNQKSSAAAFSTHQSALSSSTGFGGHSSLAHQNAQSVLNANVSASSFSSSAQTAVSYSSVPSAYQSQSQSNFVSPGVQTSYQVPYSSQATGGSGSGSGSSTFPSNQNQTSFGSHQSSSPYSASSQAQSGYGGGGGGGGSVGGPQSSYGSSSVSTVQTHTSLHVSSVPTSKLSTTLKDNVLDPSSQHSFDGCHMTSSSANQTSVPTLPTTSNSLVSGNVSALGLTTAASTNASSMSKSSVSMGKSAVPNMPPGVTAVMGHQYIMSQAGLPVYSQLYSYDDVQMLQRIQPFVSSGYYDMPLQQATSITGRENSLANAYSTGTDAKFSRGENSSPIPTTLSQQQTTQQQFMNPATLPPGYSYYYTPGGIMPGTFPQYGHIFPVPPVTNATNNTQFQKPTGYASHAYSSGYDGLSQAQDYKGCYGTSSQNAKASSGSGSNSTADVAASVYGKNSSQLGKSFDKPGFPAGTPPPFSLTGTQAGPMGAPTTPYAGPFITMIQHPSTMMHHMHQESSTGSGQRSSQSGAQQKPGSGSKPAYSANYWTTN
uniref:UBA domain-containing protein n=1 Tax=Strigamia maritima TaxID=126957 RepID=T1JFU6_STRMM